MMYIRGTVSLQTGRITTNGITKLEENYVCVAYKAGDPEPFTSIRPDRNEAIGNVLRMMQ